MSKLYELITAARLEQLAPDVELVEDDLYAALCTAADLAVLLGVGRDELIEMIKGQYAANLSDKRQRGGVWQDDTLAEKRSRVARLSRYSSPDAARSAGESTGPSGELMATHVHRRLAEMEEIGWVRQSGDVQTGGPLGLPCIVWKTTKS
jgi:hypothetical protein